MKQNQVSKNQSLSRNIKSLLLVSDLAKSTSCWTKIKANKEKIEAAIKEAIVTKVPTLKDKELKLNAWFIVQDKA
ncbi:hypothetical protein HYE14_03895 [Mycoplasmopsis bovis]|nr:hypothetical protein [Mycoplasmopsis bovis]QQH25887.1 hypothetical protein HYE14_03895 [Mycoplasmopsis bovis]